MNLSMDADAIDWQAHATGLYNALKSIANRCQHRLQKDEGVQLMPCGKCAVIAAFEADAARESA